MAAVMDNPTQQLAERTTAAEQELQDAKGALGAVVLDGGDERAASKRVSDARAELERLRFAQVEVGDRAAAAEAVERERQEAIARWRNVAWFAEYIERVGPVLKLRAELEAAEGHVMALDGLMSVLGKNSAEYEGWIERGAAAGNGLRPIDLPRETAVQMRVHGAHAYCGGGVSHAEAGQLSIDDTAAWAKALAPLVKQAAKLCGSDAKPANLPWEGAQR
jgi:hypothetical protein